MKIVPDFPIDKLKREIIATGTENYDKAIEELAKPLVDVHIAALNELCEQIGIKVPSAPTKADYANAKACVAAMKECASCRSRERSTCFKYVARNVKDKIEVDKRICNKNFLLSLIDNSNIPEMYRDATFTSYEVASRNKEAYIAAKACVSDGMGICLCGRAGVGKTMLACAMVVARAKIGKPSLFRTINEILNDINMIGGGDKVQRDSMLYRYKVCPCLVIDDLGSENISSWSKSAVFELIDSRYRQDVMTIITTNLFEDKLIEVYGENTYRRIAEMCRVERIIG